MKTETKSKHTPGPWEIYENPSANFRLSVYAPSASGIPTIALLHAYPNSLANARLIAAAPGLLSAIKNLLRTPDNDEQWKEWKEAAEAIIDKAEGN